MAAISNIQLRILVNGAGGVTGKNVIYDRKNPNGTTSKVERAWHRYFAAPEVRGIKNGSLIENPTAAQLNTGLTYAQCPSLSAPAGYKDVKRRPDPRLKWSVPAMGLTQFINHCEKNRVVTKFSTMHPTLQSASFTGAVVAETTLPAPVKPAPAKPDLPTQIQQLTKRVDELTKANAALAGQNKQIVAELAQVKKDLARLLQLLGV